MKSSITMLLFFLLSGSLCAQIYKWTDSSGDVHFSDKPHPGAEKIELPQVQTFSAPPPPAPVEPSTAEKQEVNYKITIMEPEDQATIRNNKGYVAVMLNVSPNLAPGDKIQMLFDGAPLGAPQSTTIFALQDVNRGAHTIAAEAISSDGNVIGESDSITIYMHRPRVGMVPQTRPAGRAP